MRARAPASSANLGPGFDTLAIALAIYVEVTVEPADVFSITTTGEGADLPADSTHLAAKIARAVQGHDRHAITVHSDIPVARGLGSSAALAVAAAAASSSAGAAAGEGDPFRYGVQTDGHPENAAASAFGGLVAATTIRGEAVYRRFPLDRDLRFVLVIPHKPLSTEEARNALPTRIDHRDATFNLGRMALLLAGLADHTQLTPAAAEDALHQSYRTPLFPESAPILKGLRDAGALATSWSGAGPSLLAICHKGHTEHISDTATGLLETSGVPGEVRALEADREGVTYF